MYCSSLRILHKHGGLSGLNSLRSLSVEAILSYIPSIVRQIASPHLTDLTVIVDMARVANGYALSYAAKMQELAQSLTTGTLAAMRPRITFVVRPGSDQTPEKEASEFSDARDALLTNLASLRDEGRLRIMRSVVDSQTRQEVVEKL